MPYLKPDSGIFDIPWYSCIFFIKVKSVTDAQMSSSVLWFPNILTARYSRGFNLYTNRHSLLCILIEFSIFQPQLLKWRENCWKIGKLHR